MSFRMKIEFLKVDIKITPIMNYMLVPFIELQLL